MFLDLLLKCIVGVGVVSGICALVAFAMFISDFICFVGNETAMFFGGKDSYCIFRWRDLVLGVLTIAAFAGVFILIGSIVTL